MKILFTGATGVIGRGAIPELVAAGHEVTGLHRADADRSLLHALGATPAAFDLFDAQAVDRAVAGHDVVVHFATAVPPLDAMRKRRSWRTNDRLRTEATANLVDAAVAHGVEVFIQQSVTFVYADRGDRWLDEGARVDPPAPIVESALEAERLVEGFTGAGGRGVVLRLSRLYGPGKASGEMIESVAARSAPVIGDGSNYVSNLHSEDAATAVAAAVGVPAGIYNVSDDDPVTAREYVEIPARLLGAPDPRRVPRWLARLALRSMLPLLTVSQRVSNRRFKDVSRWRPAYASVRDGWPSVLDRPVRGAAWE